MILPLRNNLGYPKLLAPVNQQYFFTAEVMTFIETLVCLLTHHCLLLTRDLQLTRPIFQKTAVYGHFGRADPDFTWEIPKTDLVY